jgi:hypothetical protein
LRSIPGRPTVLPGLGDENEENVVCLCWVKREPSRRRRASKRPRRSITGGGYRHSSLAIRNKIRRIIARDGSSSLRLESLPSISAALFIARRFVWVPPPKTRYFKKRSLYNSPLAGGTRNAHAHAREGTDFQNRRCATARESPRRGLNGLPAGGWGRGSRGNKAVL